MSACGRLLPFATVGFRPKADGRKQPFSIQSSRSRVSEIDPSGHQLLVKNTAFANGHCLAMPFE
jgi:hypothetical protein